MSIAKEEATATLETQHRKCILDSQEITRKQIWTEIDEKYSRFCGPEMVAEEYIEGAMQHL